jgi:hypothetical protein
MMNILKLTGTMKPTWMEHFSHQNLPIKKMATSPTTDLMAAKI